MQYMGSKRRLAKEILPIILKDRTEGQYFVDPFMGGANILDKVEGNRIGNDSHFYLMEMWRALQAGWNPPDLVTEQEYNLIRNNKHNYVPALVGYVGFMSFGAKWFGGYRRDVAGTKDDMEAMQNQSRRHKEAIMKQVPFLKDVQLYNTLYNEIPIPQNSIIYCDIPYYGTTKYKDDFSHIAFWKWANKKVEEGHKVFVSEYNAPSDWNCVWEKELTTNLDAKNVQIKTEKLFTK